MNVSFTICPMYLGDFKLNVMLCAHTSSYPSETLHIYCCHLVDTIGITTIGMARCGPFLLHFKDGGRKRKRLVFFLCIFFYQIYCVLFSYIQFTFPQTSKWFLSNCTNNMRILAPGPELQAIRLGYVINGGN